jgi:lipoate-protein ligase A
VERWRRLPLLTTDGAGGLARAAALLASAERDGPALAWTLVDPPALVLGRAAGPPPVDEAAVARLGVRVVRRGSGGGPVLWDAGLLALDVALPAAHRLAGRDVVLAYRWLGEALAEALRTLGVDATAVGLDEARAASRPPLSPEAALAARACFGGLSPFEVVAEGRKVVGLSQVRRRTGVLLQAGVALHLDVETLAQLLEGDVGSGPLARALRSRAAGLDELVPGLDAPAVVAAVEGVIGRREAVELVDAAPPTSAASGGPRQPGQLAAAVESEC